MDDFWERDGLQFWCTQCSHCCRHESGYVFLSQKDVDALCSHLKKDQQFVISHFCVTVPMGGSSQISLAEKENKDCIFWGDGGCSVYEGRPIQCRTYPFWQHVVNTRENWNREAKSCPGIGVGSYHAPKKIRDHIIARVRNAPLTGLPSGEGT